MADPTNGHPAVGPTAEAPEAPLIRRERTLVRDLAKLAAERAAAETGLGSGFASRRASADREVQKARKELAARLAADTESATAEHQSVRKAALSGYGAAQVAADAALQATRQKIAARAESDKETSATEHEEARWEAGTVFEAARDSIKRKFETLENRLTADAETLVPLQEQARLLLEEYAHFAGNEDEEDASGDVDDDAQGDSEAKEDGDVQGPVARLPEAITDLDAKLHALQQLTLPRFLHWNQFFTVFLGTGLILLVVLGLATGNWLIASVGAVIGSAVVGMLSRVTLMAKAKAQIGRLRPELAQSLASSEVLVARCPAWIESNRARLMADIEKKRDKALKRADDNHRRQTLDARMRLDVDAQQADEAHARTASELRRKRDEALRVADENFAGRTAAIQKRHTAETDRIEQKYAAQKAAEEEKFRTEWDTLSGRWHEGLDRSLAEIEALRAEDRRLFPPYEGWSPAKAVPPGVRFGTLHVDLAKLPGGQPKDPKLRPGPEAFDLPALLPFSNRGSLILKAGDPVGREVAVETLQAVMLRLLTSLPPAKVRFTILDPVGLGRNFAAFMHLADYDEQLITSRIWTEAGHIEQRLVDLTEQMEVVIQKYLRNEFRTIAEYNAQAGEVAEPFRILVVANYPSAFSEQAARRLASIIDSGARCGVHTLMSVDTKQSSPSAGVSMADMERHAIALAWKDGKFLWDQEEDFRAFPLELDQSPAPERVTRLMHDVGALAKEAKRVAVPFEVIAPAADAWWTGDSRPGLDVPLGRAGATRLQHLKLGRGTSQHVLVAGKTGSGKSTLMHALIVNIALRYSPDEVEFYLIDFKKGVEFKVYAAHSLPHARVIAVESEREFGISVLQRLDEELKLRGDKFRLVGAQDVASYRNSPGTGPLPRILLIIDEFQEFFVEDDKLAQEASLLLDRLVRQGRAFGIHVHLGSQTLSGAYSLARSTLGQIAIRIALQCSEADSHLILSEDNSAARLLSRPGEAIYNDANGMVEGNNLFQVVWLSDEKREDYLRRLHELDVARGQVVPRPQLVFEGNIPADVAKNSRLDALLRAPSWPAEAPRAPLAWLGEAIAIKDPTAAPLRPQSGANVMLVGQDDEAAQGIIATAVVGLAAQHPPDNARFTILDGTPADSPFFGLLPRLADTLPHPVRVAPLREMPAALGEVADEVDRRLAAEADGSAVDVGDLPAIYLVIHDLQRFRELRKSDDDFGFSRMGEEQQASPSQRFTSILRDGPGVGVHTILWCDSLANLNRTLDRQGLREFEMRILFQMNATDSSALIDSPIGSRLGENRALFASEEQGILEKFRPYNIPTDEWLATVKDRLRNRPAPQPTAQ